MAGRGEGQRTVDTSRRSHGLGEGSRCLAAAAFGLGTAPQATADDYDEYAMNGTYSVVSNGEWARMNDRYQDEPSVRSTWTVNTTCTTALTCSGKVTSSLGWTEDIYTGNGMWYVKHYVPDWIPCPDGTTGPGLQVYRFYPATDEGMAEPRTRTCTSARTRPPARVAPAAGTARSCSTCRSRSPRSS